MSSNPVHNEGRPFSCEVNGCDRTFIQATDLRQHNKRVHDKKIKCSVLKCDSKPFGRKFELETHMRQEHTGERPFLCPVCGQGFTREPRLKTHVIIHTRARPFSCKIVGCRRAFKRQDHLKVHIRQTHTALRPFSCTFDGCSNTFGRGCDLKRHIREKHSQERPFSCNIDGCCEAFKRQDSLKRHKKVVHPKETTFHCSLCSSVFPEENLLKAHIRECAQTFQRNLLKSCKFSSRNGKDLDEHMKTHENYDQGAILGSIRKNLREVTTIKLQTKAYQLLSIPSYSTPGPFFSWYASQTGLSSSPQFLEFTFGSTQGLLKSFHVEAGNEEVFRSVRLCFSNIVGEIARGELLELGELSIHIYHRREEKRSERRPINSQASRPKAEVLLAHASSLM